MPTAINERVCVVWRDDPKSADIKTLWYRPEGLIRTYLPDAIDPRAGDVPIVSDSYEIVQRLQNVSSGPGINGVPGAIAVPVSVAMKIFGWKKEDFWIDD